MSEQLVFTKAELLAAVAHLDDNDKVAVVSNYGDRNQTMQVLAVNAESETVKAVMVETGYSDSGYKAVPASEAEDYDLSDDEIKENTVYVLNGDLL